LLIANDYYCFHIPSPSRFLETLYYLTPAGAMLYTNTKDNFHLASRYEYSCRQVSYFITHTVVMYQYQPTKAKAITISFDIRYSIELMCYIYIYKKWQLLMPVTITRPLEVISSCGALSTWCFTWRWDFFFSN
jgi:hypothetical protein